jgi:hypothetical protein
MPKMLAGIALLAAGAAAAAAMAMRNRQRSILPPVPPRSPARGMAEQPATVFNSSTEAERQTTGSETDGLSRTL